MQSQLTIPSSPRLRIAPTPSGYLHIGNALSFILTWLIARTLGGSLHLRIDDLDADRKRPEYVQDIFETLEWLRLDYDTGPRNAEDFEKHWSQHHRLPHYHAAVQQLCDLEGLLGNDVRVSGAPAHLQSYQEQTPAVFSCICSRSTLQQYHQTHGRYSSEPHSARYPDICTHKRYPLDMPEAALRLAVGRDEISTFHDIVRGLTTEAVGETVGSFVVRRKDGIPAYHIASLVDDELDGINCIVRGADLLPSTAAQMLLAKRLHYSGFQRAVFFHHPLVLDDTQQKLSKSRHSSSLQSMRDGGTQPSQVYAFVARVLRLPISKSNSTTTITLDALLEAFTLEHLKSLLE